MDAKFGDALDDPEVEGVLSETHSASSNPAVRKLSRQLRIQRRLEKLQGGTEGVRVKTLLEQQLEESAMALTTLMKEGDEIVTNVRVASDSREVDRREAECVNRQKVVEQLEAEAVLGQEMFEEITSKWTDVFRCNDPIKIHEELELQKDRCNELIRQKDALIESLKDEVKKAEIKFTNDQYKQNEDIKSLGQRIEKQVSMMRNAFKEQLNIVEEVVIEENETLYDTNNRTWNSLYRKREKEEVIQMNETLDQIEIYHQEIKQKRVEGQEKYRAFKISLAETIKNLQLTQSTLKTHVLMNQEMLDYNYQVLRKKENENLVISAYQKRQINKLQEFISRSKRKIHEYNVESNAQIESLTVEVKKLQARVVEMETKAKNLSKINGRKYNQLWDLNVEDTTRTLNKVRTIDKLIHEQQLGLPWQVPKLIPSDKQRSRSQEILHREAEISHPALFEGNNVNAVDDTSCKDLLRHIFQQVAGKTDFLIEDRLQKILEPFVEEEKMLVKIDNVFQALRLKNVDDVDLLFNFFHQYAKCDVCKDGWIAPAAAAPGDSERNLKQISFREFSKTSTTSKSIFPLIMKTVNEPENVIDHALEDLLVDRELGEGESTVSYSTSSPSTESVKLVEFSFEKLPEESPSQTNRFLCQFGHPLSVHPSEVMKALTEFVLTCNKHDAKVPTMAIRLNQQFLTVSRLIGEEDVELFWKQYRDAFSKSKEQLWDGLLVGLKQYYEILKDRKQVNDEVIGLRKQNAELKHLLHSYTLDNQRTALCESQRSPF